MRATVRGLVACERSGGPKVTAAEVIAATGRRRAREEARRARDRSRRSPPPHAGTSRPGPFCGSCGGHRGPHTVHHDQARP
jgi:hypothetical protein